MMALGVVRTPGGAPSDFDTCTRKPMNTTSARNAASSMVDQAAAGAGSLADTTRDAIDSTRDKLNTGIKRARRVASTASDYAADASGVVADASIRGYRTAEDAIRTQPVLAVGAALLVGLVVGALFLGRDD
jgi:ElaB/YqjD/DUF883 family membrane-anchored ribosome-binding protein